MSCVSAMKLPAALRLLRRFHSRMSLLPDSDSALRFENFRPAARSHRYSHRSSGGEVQRTAWRRRGGKFGGRARKGSARARNPNQALRRRKENLFELADAAQ